MPIRPERKALYPKDWKMISRRIRDEAGNRCQGSPAYPDCRATNGEPHPVSRSRVILTVAHLSHDEADCRDENLRAWCQRCHLTYDAKHHANNAAAMFELRKICESEFHADSQLRNVGKMLTGEHLDSPLKAEARTFIDRIREGIENNSHQSGA
jgi:hypothetical protein